MKPLIFFVGFMVMLVVGIIANDNPLSAVTLSYVAGVLMGTTLPKL